MVLNGSMEGISMNRMNFFEVGRILNPSLILTGVNTPFFSLLLHDKRSKGSRHDTTHTIDKAARNLILGVSLEGEGRIHEAGAEGGRGTAIVVLQ